MGRKGWIFHKFIVFKKGVFSKSHFLLFQNIFGTALSGIQKTKDQPAQVRNREFLFTKNKIQVKQESVPIQQPAEKTTSMLKFPGQFSKKPSIFGNSGLGQAVRDVLIYIKKEISFFFVNFKVVPFVTEKLKKGNIFVIKLAHFMAKRKVGFFLKIF